VRAGAGLLPGEECVDKKSPEEKNVFALHMVLNAKWRSWLVILIA
jgi:hypothetical protein